MKLHVAEVFFNGQLAGTLKRTGQQYYFRYTASYLQTDLPAISPTLPKQVATFVSPVLFSFFYGLLAEGVAKQLQCRELKLPFAAPASASYEEMHRLHELTRQISVSGVQEKFSLRLENPTTPSLALTARGGQYIIKPVPPTRFRQVAELPANEHFTMQLARQVFKLSTAACAVVRFADGSPAYLTRRFDVQADGLRRAQEDFAQLAGRTEMEHGDNYKYDFSHEEMGRLIRRYLPGSYVAELTYFFRLTVFNYLVSNGDAHLKNFSLYRLPTGDYTLTPGYDLLNTSLHVQDGNGLTLDLFADGFETPSFAANAFLAYDDFLELGIRIGLPPSRVRRVPADLAGHEEATAKLLARSWLSPAMQARYADSLASRRQRLRYSLARKSALPTTS